MLNPGQLLSSPKNHIRNSIVLFGKLLLDSFSQSYVEGSMSRWGWSFTDFGGVVEGKPGSGPIASQWFLKSFLTAC